MYGGDYFIPRFQIERQIRMIDGTNVFGWEETYKQFHRQYFPLPLGTTSARHPGCVLVEESPTERVGPENSTLCRFTRIYAPVPPSRSEKRLISFTLPGQSAVQLSSISGKPIGWNQYGKASPFTLPVNADVEFNYAANNGDFTLTAPSRIKYAGALVDYVGQVFVNGGSEQVAYKSNLISEARFVAAGSTDPLTIPVMWVLDPIISRWRGLIWEMQTITVNTTALIGA